MKALLCEKATTFRRIILEIVENPHSLYQESVSDFEMLDIDYITILIN